jgi:hypothetical protein
MKQVKGKFEVKSFPLEGDSLASDIGFMRMRFEKRFEGALAGNGVVSMMGIMNREIGSGGYVALEKISGELDSMRGTFCVQHSSTMSKGKPEQSITVIPDSGTGDLSNIRGHMVIDIIEGQHFYTFHYDIS